MFSDINLQEILNDQKYLALARKLNHTQAFIMYLKFAFLNNYSYCNDQIAYIMGKDEIEIIQELNEALKKLNIDVYYPEHNRVRNLR